MDKRKSIIIIISVLIILIITILIIMNVLKKHEEKIKYIKEQNPTLVTNVDVYKVNTEKEFFSVEDCINKYFEALNTQNQLEIYSLLNEKYISQNNITTTNVLQESYKLEHGFEKFIAKKIYGKEISYDSEYQYFVYGQVLGQDYSSIQNIYIIANLDFTNMTFNITFPNQININEQEYLDIINNLMTNNTGEYIYVSDSQNSEIKSNEYNSFTAINVQGQQILYYYLDNYAIMALYYPDIAYNLLDETYKNKRFGSLDAYKEYIRSSKANLLSCTIKEYNITQKEDYLQYFIIDTNGNYYIFKVTDVMEYNLMLDFYTVELEEINNKYDESNVQSKVAINIQKIVSALNNKDYQYVYNKLSDGFKDNHYRTLAEFQEYASNTFVGNFTLTFEKFNNEGKIYIYDIALKDVKTRNNKQINMQIIMQLNDNRDFTMSFSAQ